MARTIVGAISATQENVTLSAALTAQPGDLFKIDNEIVQFGGYGSIGRCKDFTRTRVIFHRGQNETTKATHSNGAAVLGVAEALIAGSSEAEPSPIVPASGQASNANLTAFAELTLVSDRLPYANGAGTLALATFTAAGRAILDDANAAAQRATLGLTLTTLPGAEVDYVPFTAPVSITATSEGAADTVVTGTAVVYDGTTTVMVEFYAPNGQPDTGAAGRSLNCVLYDGATVISEFFPRLRTPVAGASDSTVCLARVRLTPTAASHQYIVKAYVSAGTGVVNAGVGGAADYAAGYIRVTRV